MAGRDQFQVSDRSRRRWSRRIDRQACVAQNLADRLDPEPSAAPVVVLDEYRGGHLGYISLRSSSAAANKSRCRLQDLVSLPQLTILPLQLRAPGA